MTAETVPGAGGLPAERIYHNYNQLGLPTKTYGIDVYAQEHLYSPYGETLRLTYGSGANSAWITNYYQEGTRRLDQTILDRNTDAGYRVADRRYTYDPVGNITGIANVPKALTNVVRHATRASAVDVRFGRRAGALVVVVHDDGMDAARPRPDHGLRGMRQRAEAVGGQLEAGPLPTGFQVRATLPFRDD